MSLLTKEFLADLGITLDDAHVAQLSEHFESTLDERVHEEIIAVLSDQQIEQLATLKDGDDQALRQWLQENVPDLAAIIEQETAILLGELAEGSEQL